MTLNLDSHRVEQIRENARHLMSMGCTFDATASRLRISTSTLRKIMEREDKGGEGDPGTSSPAGQAAG